MFLHINVYKHCIYEQSPDYPVVQYMQWSPMSHMWKVDPNAQMISMSISETTLTRFGSCLENLTMHSYQAS